ncbi:MAG: LPS assembly protein LptD [Sulfuritalea sp.]|jgi:LPS-assembly protein|nr:LPS assembly protein LptD [Sulfuritalea sp.]
MAQSHRGQFGTSSLLALLALTTGSAVAETLPPLRINPGLLGAGTLPPPAAPVAVEPVVAPQPLVMPPVRIWPTPAARVELAPEPARPVAEPTPRPAAIRPVPQPTPTPLPQAAVMEAPRRPEEAKAVPQAQPSPPALVIQKAQEPPQVAERPALPPLYSAHVAAGELPASRLRGAAAVMPYLKRQGELLPAFIAADQIAGQNDVEVVADGNVELRKRNTILLSDRLTYWQEADEVEAEGNVRLSRDGDRVRGPKMRMKMEDSTGFFEQPEYNIRRIKTGSAATLWTGTEERVSPELTTGQGTAARMEFEGEGKYRLTDATYSTCTPATGHDPEWFARTTDLRLNYDDEVGTARNATLYFKGAPILYSPWMSFSLNHERKSGLLTPTFGSTSRGGLEYTQPFYWNIAPNMDATVAPRLMTKRGTLWNGEYRYLEPTYSGWMTGQYLPDDKLEHKSRSSFSLAHLQNLGHGFSGTLNLNGASDGTFFSDLANGSAAIAQTNLLREGTLSYAGGWWSANLLAQSYQTLQDPSLPPVAEPYRRLPQLTVSANRRDLPLGLAAAFSGEYVNFSNPTPGMEQARRFTAYPQISLPLSTAAFNVTPKIGLNYTSYIRDQQPIGAPEKLTRSVPIFSVDSGVALERDVDWFGRKATQTLEPRLYYLYVPVRDQSQYPVFDSGAAGFNFSSIFGENRYAGGDRIGDANQLTAMLTSRLLDPLTGAETVRGSVGQLLYFSTQKVGLPGEVLRSDRQTDYLAALSVTIQPTKLYANSDLQYNPRLNQLERFNIGGRYQPEPGKLLNVDYRYTRDLLLGQPGLGQIDISGQWPVFGGWHAVGRFNYSTMDRRMIESVAGLEYDGGCWIGRVVFQRLAIQTQQSNTALFFQLEFNGLAKVGSNPLDILRRNVPGYGLINQPHPEGPLTVP